MSEENTFARQVEHGLITTYRKRLWTPFMHAVQQYHLIDSGDRIAVCISGGKDSMLLAKLMQELQRHSKYPFELVYLVMDPGYSEVNRRQIEENARRLDLPVQIFDSDIFSVANRQEKNPCYLCARMRRGHLYSRARELGCNKIALGHHFNDVIETTVMGMFWGAQLQAMLPRLRSKNFPGMELIRPLYLIHEDDIIAWRNSNGLVFLQCACRFTEENSGLNDRESSKRKEVKELLRTLKHTSPDIEKSIFSSLHAVSIDTFPGWKSGGTAHSFLERLDETPDD